MAAIMPSNDVVCDGDLRTSGDKDKHPPIRCLYLHLHESIRAELSQLNAAVHQIEKNLSRSDVTNSLLQLRERYQLLMQVNRYHASVEDEIVYPALEYKVQNVTQPYSVEHGEEDLLLDNLQHLLDAAISADVLEKEVVVRELVCKVEEVHVTLQKHLRKEEEQLFPLVLKHFTFEEQADLVVQFICCIPVLSVENVLNWLQANVSLEEQRDLQEHVARVITDPQLRRLIALWLQPNPSRIVAVPDSPGATVSSQSLLVSRDTSPRAHDDAPPSLCKSPVLVGAGLPDISGPSATAAAESDPLDTLVHLHQAIVHIVRALKVEVQAARDSNRVSQAMLRSAVQRWQFLCTVAAFHRVSEDEFVFPMARALDLGADACMHCEEEHRAEARQLTRLGRLLSELESSSRRNAGDVPQLLQELEATAQEVETATKAHLDREERELLPALRLRLCTDQKHGLVWKSLQALPLRILERIMPWIALRQGAKSLEGLMGQAYHSNHPTANKTLQQLLTKWAQRAFTLAVETPDSSEKHFTNVCGSPDGRLSCSSTRTVQQGGMQGYLDLHQAFSVTTCAPAVVRLVEPHERHARVAVLCAGKRARPGRAGPCGDGSGDLSASPGYTSKRHRASCCLDEPAVGAAVGQKCKRCEPGCDQPNSPGGHNPIDHIFQFHKALKRELHQIEVEAKHLQVVCQDPSGTSATFDLALQRLEGRFLFVRGIYNAHSVSEDEVVFPALEEKHTLRNVSQFYVLDHQQESKLFEELDAAIQDIQHVVKKHARADGEGAAAGWHVHQQQLSGLVSRLRQKCASVRASLETHVRAEEAEIWPLFAEHFTVDEQSALVGAIIGRTGAVVLQALIPWVMDSFAEDETNAMIGSLRNAAKNTRFDRWLEMMVPSGVAATPLDAELGSVPDSSDVAQSHDRAVQADYTAVEAMQADSTASTEAAAVPPSGAAAGARLESTVDLVSSEPGAVPAHGDRASRPAVLQHPGVADSSAFRPGWADIFRMNASQLETAALNSTPNDKQRQSYLAHHLMVSRFLVAQQQRMQQDASARPSVSGGMGSTGAVPVGADSSAMARPAVAVPPHRQTERGCAHYRANCSLVAPCCDQVVPCRICHDEMGTCTKELDRYKVREMVCNICGLRQPCAQSCAGCKATMARYYCSVCHLFDDTAGKDIYHCPFCNVCRRGKGLGIDAFHCMRCNACMSLDLFNKHVCREHAMESNCPICHEDLFVSSQPVKELPCGHFMHSACFAEHTKHYYTCPICFKSIGDLTLYFQMLDRLLMTEKMPAELANATQNIQCNDCSTKSTVKYHFVYHKCPSCRSYNTRTI